MSHLFDCEPTDVAGRFRFTPSPLLLTPMRSLQGGAGLGAALAAMERVTGRPAIWATAQYLSYATGTDPVDIDVTVEVAGHNTTQARCVVSRDAHEILTTHAAFGSRDLDVGGVWCAPPDAPTPDTCERYSFFKRGNGDMGDLVEIRLAVGRQLADIETDGGAGDGSFAVWVRCWEGTHDVTVSDLTFIGDFMPLAFADAIGAPFTGNSLDNTIRVGRLASTGWVLMAAKVQYVANGFGFGRAELWAEDGSLLGEVSQSAVIRHHGRVR